MVADRHAHVVQRPAAAQGDDILGPEAWDGSLDLRASAVGGETGWLDGGFGKLREGGDDGDSQARMRVAAADLAWKPQFSFAFSGLVSVVHQDGQSNGVDLNEAFLSYRSGPAAHHHAHVRRARPAHALRRRSGRGRS
jgi:hypothetical protein